MCFGTEKDICKVCGNSFEQKLKGRTREYCSDDCKDFNKFKEALERKILKINFQGKYSSQAKGDLFAIANLIKIKKL